jgi:hypothetical protein
MLSIFDTRVAICVLRTQSDTLSIERDAGARHFVEIDNVHLRSQHTQDFSYNRNYDYYILFYLNQINVIPSYNNHWTSDFNKKFEERAFCTFFY